MMSLNTFWVKGINLIPKNHAMSKAAINTRPSTSEVRINRLYLEKVVTLAIYLFIVFGCKLFMNLFGYNKTLIIYRQLLY